MEEQCAEKETHEDERRKGGTSVDKSTVSSGRKEVPSSLVSACPALTRGGVPVRVMRKGNRVCDECEECEVREKDGVRV